jgi:NAD(P)-dependent dehydrogenase (short-subunit alcohol dehydrogenase family)
MLLQPSSNHQCGQLGPFEGRDKRERSAQPNAMLASPGVCHPCVVVLCCGMHGAPSLVFGNGRRQCELHVIGAPVLRLWVVPRPSGVPQFDDINYDEGYNPWVAYRQSKLANVLFTYGLSAKLDPSLGITVNTLHPGVVRTELARCASAGDRAPLPT